MSRKAGSVAVWTVALAFGVPLHAQGIAGFASQLRADLADLSSAPTLATWQRSHPDGKVEPAYYETGKEPFEVDFARLNRWCAASVSSLQSEVVRAALFYVPPAAQGVLASLPPSENSARIRECRMQAIWTEPQN